MTFGTYHPYHPYHPCRKHTPRARARRQVSSFWGVALGNYLGISEKDFSNLWLGLTIKGLLSLLPLLFVHSLIPASIKEDKAGAKEL